MKPYTPLVTIALAAAVFCGCEKLNDLLNFNFSDSIEITIPAQTIIPNFPIDISTPEIESSSQQAFANNNTEAQYVKEAKLTELTLSINEPEDEDFDFLNKIEIYISAEDQEEVLIASKTSIPENVSRIALDVTGTNLKPYLLGEAYSIRTKVVIDEVNRRDIELEADLTFNVTADVF